VDGHVASSASLPAALSKCKHLVKPNGAIKGSEIGDQLRSNKYTTLLSIVPNKNEQGRAFLCAIDGRTPITHRDAHDFIKEFGKTLHSFGIGRGHRVALCIPNGAELALGILAVSQWATCVPLSSNSAPSELKADLERCGADLVIGPYSAGPLPSMDIGSSEANGGGAELQALAKTYGVLESSSSDARDWTVHRHVHDIADELKIPFVGLVPSPRDVTFRLWVPPNIHNRKKTRSALRTHQNVPVDYNALPVVHGVTLIDDDGMGTTQVNKNHDKTNPNSGLDEALVLFTSGTTGNKKLVPHCIGDILTAATTIALSWELQPSDVNCNLMPLFHVGGILR